MSQKRGFEVKSYSEFYLSDHSMRPRQSTNAINLVISAVFSAGRIHWNMFQSVIDWLPYVID